MKFRWPDEHWAHELSEDAKQKFAAAYRAFPCEKIPQYVADRDERAIYWAVRDAGLFRDRTCERFISDANSLESTEVNFARHFFRYRIGDPSQLDTLIRMFDHLGDRPGNSLLIDLFGFLPDWEQTGRRLAHATHHVDGSAAETLAAAFAWKFYLYGGNPGFVAECKKIAAEEHVSDDWLDDMCGSK